MILSGLEIARRLNQQIFIEPYDERLLNPNSYNLRLHEDLLVYENEELDMARENKARPLRIPPEGLVMEPGTLYLGRTLEHTRTEGLVPMLEGRSSVGRLGLYIHVTAGFGDIGFNGFWTLELHCIQRIRVYAGVQVCQIFYHTVEGDFVPYISGKYQNNRGVQPSMLFRDFEDGRVIR